MAPGGPKEQRYQAEWKAEGGAISSTSDWDPQAEGKKLEMKLRKWTVASSIAPVVPKEGFDW